MTCHFHGGPKFTDKCVTPRGTACLRAQFATFKARVKRAQNAKDWQKVLDVVAEFEAFADKYGWPDWWSIMDVAARDAIYQRSMDRVW